MRDRLWWWLLTSRRHRIAGARRCVELTAVMAPTIVRGLTSLAAAVWPAYVRAWHGRFK